MQRIAKIKSSADYQRISRGGKRWHGPAFVIQTSRTEPDAPFRVGLTASRKVGGAVVRNRAKRRLREMIRTFHLPFPAGVDMVLVAKTDAARRDFVEMGRDLEQGLKATGVLP